MLFNTDVSPDILICMASYLRTAIAVHNLCAETHKVTRSNINLQLGKKFDVVDLALCSVLTTPQQTVDNRARIGKLCRFFIILESLLCPKKQ